MKPTVGRIVIFKQGEHETPCNGTIYHPAIITRVLGDTEDACVNLHVFFDANPVSMVTSVPHHSFTRPECRSWSWPPRND